MCSLVRIRSSEEVNKTKTRLEEAVDWSNQGKPVKQQHGGRNGLKT